MIHNRYTIEYSSIPALADPSIHALRITEVRAKTANGYEYEYMMYTCSPKAKNCVVLAFVQGSYNSCDIHVYHEICQMCVLELEFVIIHR